MATTSIIIALLALGVGVMRLALPLSGFHVSKRLASAGVVLSLSLFGVAIILAVWSVFVAYDLQLQFVQTGKTAIDGSWLLAVVVAAISAALIISGGHLQTRYDPEVRILSPLGGEVDWKSTVCGSVWPPDTAVQLFVRSRDDRWHPKAAAVTGAAWRVEDCQIGNQDVPPGTTYKLIAISNVAEGLAAMPKPPRGHARSQVVRIRRR